MNRLFAPVEKRSLTGPQLYELIAGGGGTYAGPPVSEDSAMRYSAVYACVRIISESIAALPLVVMRERGRNKERALDHPLFPILHSLANPEMTSFEWRELMMSHVCAWGNGYSEKEFDRNGRLIALWPLNPASMENIERRRGTTYYFYRTPDQELREIPAVRIHHIKGLGNGVKGYSPIQQAARQATGLGLATEEFGARFFSNGARPGLLLRHPGKLSQPAHERLRLSFASEHQGLSNSHRVKILEEGMDIATIGIPPNEAQFLETRKFQVTEIARIFRVPPHMLADLDRATFSNIEHQSLSFVQNTLLPWLVRHEQAISRDLLAPEERATVYAKYIVAGMLRGDMQTRAQAYTTGIMAGYYTRNEVRELEDLNPLEGLDEPLMPLNMVEVGAAPPSAPTSPSPTRVRPDTGRVRLIDTFAPVPPRRSEGLSTSPLRLERRAEGSRLDRQRLMNRHIRLFEDALSRVVKRETGDIRKVLPRINQRSNLSRTSGGIEGFEKWLAGFYEELRGWMPDYLRALMLTYAETMLEAVADEVGGEPAPTDDELREWIEGYLANFVEVYAVGGERQLRTLLAEAENAEEAEQAVATRMDEWEETKAGKSAMEQAFEAGNALAIYGYGAAGIKFLVWRARGESCPLCRKWNGRKIPLKGSFAEPGDEVTAEGVDPLPVIRTIKHGPLHAGCDCVVLSA